MLTRIKTKILSLKGFAVFSPKIAFPSHAAYTLWEGERWANARASSGNWFFFQHSDLMQKKILVLSSQGRITYLRGKKYNASVFVIFPKTRFSAIMNCRMQRTTPKRDLFNRQTLTLVFVLLQYVIRMRDQCVRISRAITRHVYNVILKMSFFSPTIIIDRFR